jgi:hypothetical protein
MQEGTMNRIGLIAVTAAMAICVAVPAMADEEIGLVYEREFRGAEGTRTNGETRDLRWNGPVFSEETVTTGPDAHTELQFMDETHLSVGANSQVVLDSFVYDPSQNTGDAVITFGKGVFRWVTGDMNKDAYQLETPSATLAIRGTIFWLKVDERNNVTLYVEEGAVEMIPCNDQPGGVVNAGETGFVNSRCDMHTRDGNGLHDIIDGTDSRGHENDGPSEHGDSDNDNDID